MASFPIIFYTNCLYYRIQDGGGDEEEAEYATDMGKRANDEYEQHDFDKHPSIALLQKSVVRVENLSRRRGRNLLQGKSVVV